MGSEYLGVCDLSYLAVSPVNLVDHVSEQNLLLHSTVEFLVLRVLADLKVVSFEGLAHAEIKRRQVSYLYTHITPAHLYHEINITAPVGFRYLLG